MLLSRQFKLAIVAACLWVLAGCSGLQGTGGLQYIEGNGNVLQVQPEGRGEPVDLTGTSLTGEQIDLAVFRGRPVVVNVWWSGCVPCRTEMPMLVAAAHELEDTAYFLGINIRDYSVEQAQAFAEAKGVDYPSLYDSKGQALLAFSGDVSPRSTPATLVLDSQGRIAALISGPIPSQLTLTDLVEQIAGEDG